MIEKKLFSDAGRLWAFCRAIEHTRGPEGAGTVREARPASRNELLNLFVVCLTGVRDHLVMAIVLVQRGTLLLHCVTHYVFRRRLLDVLTGLLAGFSAALLTGCALDDNDRLHSCVIHPSHPPRKRATIQSASQYSIPPAMLKPQLPPDCGSSDDAQSQAGQGDPNATLAQRIRNEYDLACYKKAEELARERLRQLQIFVAKETER
jgi:hypothetical protein